MPKVPNFKPKTRKGAVKRLKVTAGGDSMKGKLVIERINNHHRLINKTGVRKLKAARTTTLGKTVKKYKKALSGV